MAGGGGPGVCPVPQPDSLRKARALQVSAFSPQEAVSVSADCWGARKSKPRAQKVQSTFIPSLSARLWGVALKQGHCGPGACLWLPPPFTSGSAARAAAGALTWRGAGAELPRGCPEMLRSGWSGAGRKHAQRAPGEPRPAQPVEGRHLSCQGNRGLPREGGRGGGAGAGGCCRGEESDLGPEPLKLEGMWGPRSSQQAHRGLWKEPS